MPNVRKDLIRLAKKNPALRAEVEQLLGKTAAHDPVLESWHVIPHFIERLEESVAELKRWVRTRDPMVTVGKAYDVIYPLEMVLLNMGVDRSILQGFDAVRHTLRAEMAELKKPSGL